MGFLSKLLTAGEGRQLKKYRGVVDQIASRESHMESLSDAEFAALTSSYKERISNGESPDALLVDAFATVREASKRVMGMRHFDVQLIGGMALHDGAIAEMKTGEGKTLVSTLAGYLNACSNKGVHIVTVNDYLAKRDSEWMGRLYHFLGMDVGLVQNGMRLAHRKPAYLADVTYGTNSEFGFDYLRDNMVTRADMRVQRGHAFAIVDEVDSILIDEARTPLIISGAGMKAANTYKSFARAVKGLVNGTDFELDEGKRTIIATEAGLAKVENRVGIDDLYSDPSGQLANHLQQALRAEFMFHKDVDYVVMNGEIKIVDEFTGRIMEGRRYSEGLHQALEAKENVRIREENQTLASITLQNYFRLYDKLAGMTGTAMTEDAEFRQIYKLGVVAIPPNKPVAREDRNDLIYRTEEAKYQAVVEDVIARHKKGQPCLVGTVSIESSEKLSRMLDKRGIEHSTLNAKHHAKEADIIAQAGRLGAVTIATNMAGRGTDILLGGNAEGMVNHMLEETGISVEDATEEQREHALRQAQALTMAEQVEVLRAGGLAVLGTERHESRRIDNQLRGRAGRQGDPGVTQFYLSLEDDLMRKFGGARMDSIGNMLQKTGTPDDMPLQAGLVSKAIENAQHQVEVMHFESRKRVLEYDDVMNLQRGAIYGERNAILDGKDLTDSFEHIIDDVVDEIIDEYCPAKTVSDEWDMHGLDTWVADMTGTDAFKVVQIDHDEDPGVVAEAISDYFKSLYNEKREMLGDDALAQLQSQVMLRIIDVRWMTHLQDMDYLRQGIGLRAYAQRDPLVEYKDEAHAAFAHLTSGMYSDLVRILLRLHSEVAQDNEDTEDIPENVHYSSPEDVLSGASPIVTEGSKAPVSGKAKTYVKDQDDPYANVGRNDPCPCGSGLKYKKCHGQ